MLRVIALHQKSYELFKWAADAIDRGFLRFSTIHQHATLPGAARAWIREHHLNLPASARPSDAEIDSVANLFAAFLESSFELVENPDRRLYSPDAHCFCPMCSWLVAAPRLRPKKLEKRDKSRAQLLMRDAVQALGLEHGRELSNEAADLILQTAALREAAALVAYGCDLLRRERGQYEGPASLALWRAFAWNDKGSPKKKFKLEPELIIAAQERLLDEIARRSERRP